MPTTPPTGLTVNDEVTFVSGITNTGTVAAISGLNWDGNGGGDSTSPDNVVGYNPTMSTASKWGNPTPGTGGGVQGYYFDPTSKWTPAEKKLLISSLSIWSAEANIQFVETNVRSKASLDFTRDAGSGSSAESGGQAPFVKIGGTTLGNQGTGVSLDIDTDRANLSNGFNAKAMDSLVHEEGHYLGFFHGGPYDGTVNKATQQYSPYDTYQYSIMSYINPDNESAKFFSSYATPGTEYEGGDPSTPMTLDILAAQRLYGLPTSTPLSGGQVFGFHTNITGPIKDFFDFKINTSPVVTLFDTGTGNTLDLSGYGSSMKVNLNPGSYSSFAGLVNNLGIDYNTKIDGFVGGKNGNTVVIVNNDADTITDTGDNNEVDFAGKQVNYVLAAVGGNITVTNTASGIQDLLSGVQTLKFSDQTVLTSSISSTDTWTSAKHGKWTDGTRWSTGSAPNGAQAVSLSASSGTYRVAVDTTGNVAASVVVSAPAASAVTLGIANTGALAVGSVPTAGDTTVSDNGTLRVSGGTLSTSGALNLASASGAIDFGSGSVTANNYKQAAGAFLMGEGSGAAALTLTGMGFSETGGTVLIKSGSAINTTSLSDSAGSLTLKASTSSIVDTGAASFTGNAVFTDNGTFTAASAEVTQATFIDTGAFTTPGAMNINNSSALVDKGGALSVGSLGIGGTFNGAPTTLTVAGKVTDAGALGLGTSTTGGTVALQATGKLSMGAGTTTGISISFLGDAKLTFISADANTLQNQLQGTISGFADGNGAIDFSGIAFSKQDFYNYDSSSGKLSLENDNTGNLANILLVNPANNYSSGFTLKEGPSHTLEVIVAPQTS